MKPMISLLWGLVLLVVCHLTAWADISTPPQNIQVQIGSIPTTKSITQHGITWIFAEFVEYGQFVNGDYWVVDPGTGVKITNISPGYATTPRIINGSMRNPSTFMQGYDNMQSYLYDAGKNVGIGISPSTPLTLSNNVSLVSTISNLRAETHPSYVDNVAVLTCLSAPAPAGSFRPGIGGTNKTLHNINNVNFSLLKKLAIPAGQTITVDTINTYANYFQTVWLDHHSSNEGRYLHPRSSGMDNYYYSINFAEAALLLHLNFTDEEKRSLLINYIQLGIDLYSYLQEGGISGWWPNGGHGNGRKWPILFAGIMLNYEPMKNIGQVSGDYINNATFNYNGTVSNVPSNYKYFGEDGQTFYVNQYMVDLTSNTQWIIRTDTSYYINTTTWAIGNPGTSPVGPWHPDTRNVDGSGNFTCRPYTIAMIGMPEFGIKYASAPNESDSSWRAEYRWIQTGGSAWSGFVLAARIMGAKSLWNHNALFDYVDRYMAISAGQPDPFGYTVYMESAGYRPGGILEVMWNTYRPHY